MKSIVKSLAKKEVATLDLKYYSDPGHGWLEVPCDIIRKMGIAIEISSYSYMTLRNVYLEEDSDMNLFLSEALRHGMACNIEHKVEPKRESVIREYGYFNAEMINNPIQIGDIVELHADQGRYIVLAICEKHFLLSRTETVYQRYQLLVPSDKYTNFIRKKVG